jgi:prepilin-type N-terminal cleavage/methylation domain-containing protein
MISPVIFSQDPNHAASGHVTGHRGFTLIDLSVVLVILGLLVGGILGGRSLIRASELRSVSAQLGSFVAATNNFREKYEYYPGDMPNATVYWGKLHALAITCRGMANTGTDTRTCDGDGDHRIRTVLTDGPEPVRYWQHLANAGMIEGRYTGAYDSTGHSKINAPTGKITSSLWMMFDFDPQSGSGSFFDGEYGNSLIFGGYVAGDQPNSPIMTPGEMWTIDTKIDDGKPGMGKMVIYANGDFTSCTTGANSAALSADYLLTSSTKACVTAFRQLF